MGRIVGSSKFFWCPGSPLEIYGGCEHYFGADVPRMLFWDFWPLLRQLFFFLSVCGAAATSTFSVSDFSHFPFRVSPVQFCTSANRLRCSASTGRVRSFRGRG